MLEPELALRTSDAYVTGMFAWNKYLLYCRLSYK